MKLFSVILPLMILNSAHAADRKLVECKVIKVVDSSYLEESLSVEEYPEVELTEDTTGAKKAWLGSSLYQEKDGDVITPGNAVGFDKNYTINPSHQLEQYLIVVSGGPMSRDGKLWGRARKKTSQVYGEYELIALLKCK